MSAAYNRRDFMVVRGPELTKEQQRLKAPATLRRYLRTAQLKLVPAPCESSESEAPARKLQSVIFSSMLGLLLCLASTLLALPARAEEPLSISLKPEANVSGKLYYISDVATYISGNTELWVNIAAEPAGYCPLPGATASLTSANVLGILKQRGYPWQSISVTGDSVAITLAPPQSVDSSAVLDVLQASLAEQLGVPVEICELRALPVQDLPGGSASLEVRYPDKPGQWLPVSIAYSVDGRLRNTLTLAQYVSFKLPVTVAAAPVPGRTKLSAADIALEIAELRPGSEVVTDTATVLGLEVRIALLQGARIKLSQLKRSYDVERGAPVTLVIGGAGVELRATGTALNSAYSGQNVLVKRDGDGLRFTGELTEDNVVVVQ